MVAAVISDNKRTSAHVLSVHLPLSRALLARVEMGRFYF